MSRRLLAVTAALALLLGLAGGAGAQSPPATVEPGTLTVALNMPADGFQVGAVRGEEVVFARGFEVDLARFLARRLGLQRVRFVQEPRFLALLAAGPKPWDMALSQVTITAARRRAVDFSIPYLMADQGVLLRRNLDTRVTTIADLRPLRICAQRGTTGAATVRRRVRPASPPRLHDDQTALMQDLQVGRCDAVVQDAPILGTLRALAPTRYGRFAGIIPTGERYGVVFPEGSPLGPAVNRALRGLQRDGVVARLSRRWLTTDVSGLPILR